MNTNPFSSVLVALSFAAISLGGCAVSSDDQDALLGYEEDVGEAEQAVTTVPFPGSLTATLGASTISSYEPSGLARRNGVLYMASDKGEIARYVSSSNTWTTEISGSDDFESLTTATNNQLMVGVEGTTSNAARIRKVNIGSPSSLGQSWTLSNVSNMEAMTFVPDNYTPFGPANTTGHPSDFNGYFFVATQNNVGSIAAYRLDQGSSTGTKVGDYAIDITLQTSDLVFANGVLYALFDDHNATDLLAVYVVNTNPSNKVLGFQKQYGLPNVNGTDFNYEGITFDGQTIYLGRDNNNNSSDNGVYQFANTIIYPQTVLPPVSW